MHNHDCSSGKGAKSSLPSKAREGNVVVQTLFKFRLVFISLMVALTHAEMSALQKWNIQKCFPLAKITTLSLSLPITHNTK